jgi:hypothetical protein
MASSLRRYIYICLSMYTQSYRDMMEMWISIVVWSLARAFWMMLSRSCFSIRFSRSVVPDHFYIDLSLSIYIYMLTLVVLSIRPRVFRGSYRHVINWIYVHFAWFCRRGIYHRVCLITIRYMFRLNFKSFDVESIPLFRWQCQLYNSNIVVREASYDWIFIYIYLCIYIYTYTYVSVYLCIYKELYLIRGFRLDVDSGAPLYAKTQISRNTLRMKLRSCFSLPMAPMHWPKSWNCPALCRFSFAALRWRTTILTTYRNRPKYYLSIYIYIGYMW